MRRSSIYFSEHVVFLIFRRILLPGSGYKQQDATIGMYFPLTDDNHLDLSAMSREDCCAALRQEPLVRRPEYNIVIEMPP